MTFLGKPNQTSGSLVWDGSKFVASVISGSGGSSTTTGSLLAFTITDYAFTTNTGSSPETIGQFHFDSSKYSEAVTLNVILAASSGSVSSSVQLLNLDDLALVEIGGAGVTSLENVGVTPTRVSSVDLKGAVNFNATSGSNYELQLWTSNGSVTVFAGGATFETTGVLVSSGSGGGGDGNLLWQSTTADVSFNTGSIEVTGSALVKDTLLVLSSGLGLNSPSDVFTSPSGVIGLPYQGKIVSQQSSGPAWETLIGYGNLHGIGVPSENVVVIGNSATGRGFLLQSDQHNHLVVDATGSAFSAPLGHRIGSDLAFVSSEGADVYFSVSGAIGSKDSSTRGVSLFGGDVHISGNLTVDGTAPGGSSATSSSLIRNQLVDFTSTTATSSNPSSVGQIYFNPAEFAGTITLRSVLSNTNASTTSSIKLLNVTSGAYVEIGGTGVDQLNVVGTTPTLVESSDLRSAVNFSTSTAIYELQAFTSDGNETAFVGGGELRTEGVLVTASLGNVLSFGITDYASTTNTSSLPESVGQLSFNGSGYSSDVFLVAILTAASASVSASVQLLNLDDQAFVEIGGTGVTTLENVGTTSTRVQSVNLKGAANFNALSSSNYELQLFTSNELVPAIVGGAAFETTGVLASTGATGSAGGADTDWTESGTELRTTSSVAISSQAEFASARGADVFFFVSGTLTSGSATDNVAVFGGSVRVSGNLAIGSGSVLITEDSVQVPNLGSATVPNIRPKGDTSQGIILGGSNLIFRRNDQTEFQVVNLGARVRSELQLGSTTEGIIGSSNTVRLFSGDSQNLNVTPQGVAISDNGGGNITAEGAGADVVFYVSGTFGSGSATDRIALFGGDVKVSGTLAVGSGSAFLSDDRLVFTSASIQNVGGNLTLFDDSNLTGQTLTQLASGGSSFFFSDTANIVETSGSLEVSGGLQVKSSTFVTGDLTVGTAGDDVLFVDSSLRRIGLGRNTFTFGGRTAEVVVGSDDTAGSVATMLLVNDAGSNGLPFLSFVRGSNLIGNIAGRDAEAFDLLNGLTFTATSGRQFGWRVGTTSIGRWGANSGLFVTGTLNASGDATFGSNVSAGGIVSATGGFSGSLTTLTDGSPYLLAGESITLTTGATGQVTISVTTSSNGFAVDFGSAAWETEGSNQIFTVSGTTHNLQTSNLQIQLYQSTSNGHLLTTAQETLISGNFDVKFTISSGSAFDGRIVLLKAGSVIGADTDWFDSGNLLSTSASIDVGGNVSIGGQAFPTATGSLTLTGSSLTTNCNDSNVFFHTLTTGGLSLSTASNQQAGASYVWLITQDGTGGFDLTFDTNFFTIIGNSTTIVTGANKSTVLSGLSNGTKIFLAIAGDES